MQLILRAAGWAAAACLAGAGCREPQFSGGDLPALEQGRLAALQSDLSPATLFHVGASHVTFFSGMAQYGLGGPSHSAYSAITGPTVIARNAPFHTEVMIENWILVWFAGAEGWTNWDVPVALYLQKKPSAVRLDQDGLHLSFAGAGGTIVLLPLYGYTKMPQPGVEIPVKTERRGHKLLPYAWDDFLPRDVLIRIRYWAGATREFPIHCEETFRVHRGRESVTIRQQFHWLSLPDEWDTKPLRLAPVSPTIALAHGEAKFPVRFSRRVADMDMPTPFGPVMGVQNASSFEMTFSLLGYIHRTETANLAAANQATVAALEELRAAATALAARAGSLPPSDLVLLARAIPHLHEGSRAELVRALTNQFGIVLAREASDRAAAGPDAALLEAIWAMSHFSGDWAFAKNHWPAIRSRLALGKENRWAGFGCEQRASIALEAGPALAMARMAFHVEDIETYHYACYLFVRELAHVAVKLRAGAYFSAHHPWHSMEPPSGPAFLTRVTEAGWQLSHAPRAGRLKDLAERWAGFSDPDLARFLVEHASAAARADLEQLEAAGDATAEEVRSMPSLLLLGSLLRNDPLDKLAARRKAGARDDPRRLADALAILRAASETQLTELISAEGASPFAAGAERDVPPPKTELIQAIEIVSPDPNGAEAFWPRVSWLNWRAPSGAPWNFGHVSAGSNTPPLEVRLLPLNWNSRIAVYDP